MRTPKIVQATTGCVRGGRIMFIDGKKYPVIGFWDEHDRYSGHCFKLINESGKESLCFQKHCTYMDGGDWIVVEWNEDEPTQNVNAQDPQDEAERVRAAAPEMLKALQSTQRLLSEMRKYLPKSIKNADKFLFENVNAAIGAVIHKATQP